MHTGEIIAGELKLVLEIHPHIYEQFLGDLRGKSYDAIRDDPSFDPARSWQWRPPGGESHEDVLARVAPALDEIASKFPDDEVVVVSHGGVMRCFWRHVTGSWDNAHVPANCGIVVVEHARGKYGHPVVVGEQISARDSGG
jgi:broad specificity phosphatase PhoE